MFLPVACLKCGKVFQVPKDSAGTEVACPWCQESTAAIPVSGMPSPLPSNSLPEPLSLDDEGTPALRPASRLIGDQKPRRRSWVRPVAMGILLVAAVLAVTLAILRYGSGFIPPSSWVEFTP